MTAEVPYEDPERPASERVDDLLGRMTLSEKVGQLVGVPLGLYEGDRDVADVLALVDEYGVGSVAPAGWAGSYYDDPAEVARVARELQAHAREETRLGIPLLFTADAVHGHAYVRGATTFPSGLGAAATWNPELTEQAGRVTARELRATGIHQNYAPTCDVARDPRWGRTFETYGESPHLVAEHVAAEVEGLQGQYDLDDEHVLATAKHFPAYGEPRRGDDAAPVEISAATLRRAFLPPFQAAIDAGVRSVMPSYSAVGGEPSHASRRYLRELLRGELAFDGHVVSDWGGVDQLHEDHHVTEDARASSRAARLAGVDLFSVGMADHLEHTRELVESGELSESDLDASVRRVLRAKVELGLFETEPPSPERATDALATPGHREVARESVAQSLTLLTNDDCLPLSDPDEIFVGGPNADDLVAQVGGWSVWEDHGVHGTTIREGLEAASDATVTYERGSRISERDDAVTPDGERAAAGRVDGETADESDAGGEVADGSDADGEVADGSDADGEVADGTDTDLDVAVEKAAAADVAVLAVGEDWYIHEFSRRQVAEADNAAFPSRVELELPEPQRELGRAIHETGTPTVGVLVTGRPLAVPWMAEHLDALLLAYYPGGEGGRVIADALLGEVEPAGRLPISVPRSAGQLPTYFNHLPHPTPIGEHEHVEPYDPLFEFGHGLGYAEIEAREMELSAETIGPGGTVDVEVTLENESDRAGSEVAQLYVTDRYSSRVTPVRELAGFQRVEVDAGDAETVTLALAAEDLGVAGSEGPPRVEPGVFDLRVGDLEAELRVESEYEQ